MNADKSHLRLFMKSAVFALALILAIAQLQSLLVLYFVDDSIGERLL
jgi:hypothetical protein